MSDAVVKIRVVGKDEASAELKKFQRSVQELDTTVKQKKGAIADLFGPLASRLGTAGIVAGIGLVGRESLKAASNLEELTSKARFVYQESFPRIAAEAERISEEVGRAGSSILGFSTDFAAILSPMGIAKDKMGEMSTELAQLAVDLASFHNRSDIESFTALRSAITGEIEPLKRFGVVMDQANLSAFALEKGIKKKIEAMTQAEKTALRFNFIMERTTLAQGDAARTSGSFANQLRRAKDTVKELFEVLGKPVIPVAAKALGFFSEVIQNNITALKALGTAAEYAWSAIAKVAQATGFENVGIKDYRRDGLKGFDVSSMSDEELKAATLAATERRKALERAGNISLGGGGAKEAKDELGKLKEALEDVTSEYWASRADIDRALGQLANDHKEKMGQIKDQIDDVKESMSELEQSFKRAMQGIDQSEADVINSAKEKIEDLQRKLNDLLMNRESMQNQGLGIDVKLTLDIEEVKADLEKEKAGLAAILASAPKGVTQLADTRAGMSDAQKEFEDLQKRRLQEQEDHTKRKTQIQEEIDQLNEKKRTEEAAYQAHRDELQETKDKMVEFHNVYIESLTNVEAVTEETVTNMKKKLDELKQTISEIDALMRSKAQITGGQTVTDKAKMRAQGGVVTEPFTVVGERGIEVAKFPFGTEIIPNDKARDMMGGTSVTIGAIHVHDEADENRLIEKIRRLIELQSFQAA